MISKRLSRDRRGGAARAGGLRRRSGTTLGGRRHEGGTGNEAAPQGFTPPELTALDKLGTARGRAEHRRLGRLCRGRLDRPRVDWVTPFEKATGCQVNVKTAPTSDDMVNLMKTGQYDVVSASGDASLRMIASGDVEPVNTDLVPNYADVFDALKMKPWNSVDGRVLRHPARPRREPADVPHRQGVSPRADLVGRGVRRRLAVQGQGHGVRLADLHRGRRALPDEDQARTSASRTRTRSTTSSSPRRSTCSRSRTPTSASTGADYTKEITAFKNGDSVVGTTWQIIANLAQADKAPVKAVLPERGRDRLVGHLDGRDQEQAQDLRLQVARLDHQPDR